MRHSTPSRRAGALALLISCAGVTLAPVHAHAADVTRVASSFEDDDVLDVHFGVAYRFHFERAAILREWNSGRIGDDDNRLVRDLMLRRFRHTLTPSVEVGVFRDLSLYAQLPIVLADSRTYSFDQRPDDCSFGSPSGSPPATCVNKRNSTTIRDEVVPAAGFDAANPSDPFASFADPQSAQIFRGPVRRGLDQLHVGLKYAVLNQDKRSHMPTWVVAFDGRFAIGRAMRMSRDYANGTPVGNTRVGQRIHQLGVWTALSRRFGLLDPFFTAHWRQSLRAANSEFEDFSGNGSQTRVLPQSHAGLSIGTEVIPFERKAKQLRVAVFVLGASELHYGGRGYSEIWELLADSPAMAGSFAPTVPGACDRNAALAFARANPGNPEYLSDGDNQCQRFTGVTDLQDYASLALTGGVTAQLGPYVNLGLDLNLSTDTRHFITSAERGAADAGGTNPEQVESGTAEVNPVRRDVVDSIGRRYAVDDVTDLNAFLRVLVMF